MVSKVLPIYESKCILRFSNGHFLLTRNGRYAPETTNTEVSHAAPHLSTPSLFFGDVFIWQVARIGRKIPLKTYPESDCRDLG